MDLRPGFVAKSWIELLAPNCTARGVGNPVYLIAGTSPASRWDGAGLWKGTRTVKPYIYMASLIPDMAHHGASPNSVPWVAVSSALRPWGKDTWRERAAQVEGERTLGCRHAVTATLTCCAKLEVLVAWCWVRWTTRDRHVARHAHALGPAPGGPGGLPPVRWFIVVTGFL